MARGVGASGWGGGSGSGGAKGRREQYIQREGVTSTYPDGKKITIMKVKGADGENMYFSKDQFGNYKEIESMHGSNLSVSQIAENAKKNGGKATILKESDFKKEDAITKADRDYKDKHQIDYSLGYGLGPGFSVDKDARKRARMSRLANRRRR